MFNVGDRVKVVDVSEFSFAERQIIDGLEGTVVCDSGPYIRVKFDEDVDPGCDRTLLFKPYEIEVI